MEVAEKTKITEAMKLCESKMQSFFNHLDDSLSKEESVKFKDFILHNTFFAGGVFRSVLSDAPVNSIGVFFKSFNAVIEFKHMVLSQPTVLFREVSDRGSYNWKPPKGPKLSFTTMNAGPPDLVIKKFDLSFNQHYYDMQRMDMLFDRDTFKKAGRMLGTCKDRPNAIMRSIKFLNEGWKIDQESILETIKLYWNKETPFMIQKASNDKPLLTKSVYTDREYFGGTSKVKESPVLKDKLKQLSDKPRPGTWTAVSPSPIPPMQQALIPESPPNDWLDEIEETQF